MTLKPSFRQRAFREYFAARRWYERRRHGLGAQFEHEIDHAIVQACATPLRFAEVTTGVRRVRASRFPFVVYYRVRGNKLIVLAVFHARRNPTIWQTRG